MPLSSMPPFLQLNSPQPFGMPGNYGQPNDSLVSYFYDSSAASQQLLTPTSMTATSHDNFEQANDMYYPDQRASDLLGQTYSDNGFGLMPLFDGQCSPPLELQ